jgi:hypothetical protein
VLFDQGEPILEGHSAPAKVEEAFRTLDDVNFPYSISFYVGWSNNFHKILSVG